MARVSFHTLGCKLNFAETSTLARRFEARGFETVPFGDPADVTVINTCTVTEQADGKCRNAIRRAVKANDAVYVIVTGCYAQMGAEQIAAIDGVDLVLGNTEKFHLFSFIDGFRKEPKTQVHVSCIDSATTFGSSYSTSRRTRAFLKVQDGCDYSCSFCTIPMARGPSRSQTMDETIRESLEIAGAGVAEIVLTGVNIGLYGRENGDSLLDLIRRLEQEVPVDRIRISSIEPNLLSNDIIDFVAEARRFVPHFHIPLQSGNDTVLAGMRRRYRRDLYRDRVARIKERMPQAAIGCDVIVGFPSESDAGFEETVAFLEALDVSYLHVFTYSERPGTAAVDEREKLDGDTVPARERARRSRSLRMMSEKKRLAFYESQGGSRQRVLWEHEKKKGWMYGWTDNYVRIRTKWHDDRAGSLQEVTLGAVDGSGMFTLE